MSVIPITVSISLGLVFVFVALFWREQRRRRFASAERDSLLPLAEEIPHPVVPAVRPGGPEYAHRHQGEAARAHRHHEGGECGCQRGEHPPCAGCRRETVPATVSPAL